MGDKLSTAPALPLISGRRLVRGIAFPRADDSAHAVPAASAKQPALSSRERECLDAILGIDLVVLVYAGFFWSGLEAIFLSSWQRWFFAVAQILKNGVFPNFDQLASGALVSAVVVWFFLFLGALAARLRQPWIMGLAALWWWIIGHALAVLLLFTVLLQGHNDAPDLVLPVFAVACAKLILAINGLRATRARERAEGSER